MCVCVCVCVLFYFRQFVCFFTLGTRLRISKFCVDLCKKSDRTRCLAVSILEYNINLNVGFLKEERNSVVIHR